MRFDLRLVFGHEQRAGMEGETFRARVAVWELGDGLATYFDDVAARWAGFDGELEYSSLEGTLKLAARHDGKGTVTLIITLRQPWPPTWSLRASLELGAGAHLEGIAGDVRALVAEGLRE